MKTINFRGITESLSDGEMKNVLGGGPEKIKEAPKPEEEPTVYEAACEGKILWGNCKIITSTGDLKGKCTYRGDKLTCILD